METRSGTKSALKFQSEMLLAAVIMLWVALILLRIDPGGLGLDPDSYMWLARFRDGDGIFHGGYFPRDNAPYGTVVPWTMSFDGALAVFYAIGRLFADRNGALYFAARVVSPFFCVTIAPLMFFGLRPFFSLRARVVISGLAATAPALVFFSLPGDADHHAMVVWLSVLFAVALIRYLFLDRPRYRDAALAGAAAAVALWTSPEEFVVIATGLSALVLHRCLVESAAARSARANDLVLSGALAITLTAALLVDRPYDGLWAADVDRLSIVYVSFAWLYSAALIGLDAYLSTCATFSRTRNLVAAALFGGTAFVCWVAMAPGILGGPFGQVDRALLETPFFVNNLEMLPLWRLHAATVAAWICLVLIGIAFAVLIAKSSGPQRRLWIGCAMLMIPIVLLGIRFYRSVNFAEVLGAIPLGIVLAYRTRQYPKYMGYSAVALSTGVMLGAYAATMLLWTQLKPPRDAGAMAAADCGPDDLSAAIGPIRNTDAIVMTDINFAPMVLYLSPTLRTVAAPFIRNTQGILDALAFFDARDDDDARAILDKRGVRFVLICDIGQIRRAGSVGDRIFREPPAWLQPVGPGTERPGFRLYRVRSGNG